MAGPSEMIIRPWDFVPGYLIADGQPAQPLTGALDRGGEVLPGPRAGEVWVRSAYRFQSLSLARVDGSVTGVSMRLPAGGWWLAGPNGRGDVLLTRVGEIYDIWPGGSRHIGGMLAANARTQRVQGLGAQLPWLSQIAIRNAPR